MLQRYALATLVCLVVLTGAVIAVLSRAGEAWSGHVPLALWAAAIGLPGAIAGFVPLERVLKYRQLDQAVRAWMAGAVLRLAVTGGGFWLVFHFFVDPRKLSCFALWTAGYYLAVLGWETAIVVLMVQPDAERESDRLKSKEENHAAEDDAHTGL